MSKVTVLFHDGCFDGAASAALFSALYRERFDPAATFTYRGLAHGKGGPLDPSLFDGEVNAIVDFRYSISPKLDWYFDHHVSAFPNPGERETFDAANRERHFHDAQAKSCTRFIARVARERFGFTAVEKAPLAELIHWAEIIDGALFPDARTAVRLEEPALKLMLVIEANPGPGLLPELILEMQHKSLAELVALPRVAEALTPLYARHLQTVELVRARARCERGVVQYDTGDQELGAINKFISYDLFPEAAYSVSVSVGPGRSKVSVGSNPWAKQPRRHDLARLCEAYGGGGHPVVGAVSLPRGELPRARQIAREIADRLMA